MYLTILIKHRIMVETYIIIKIVLVMEEMSKVYMSKEIRKGLLSLSIIIGIISGMTLTDVYAQEIKEQTKSTVDWHSEKLLPIKDKEMLIQILEDKGYIGEENGIVYCEDILYEVAESTTEVVTESTDFSSTNVQVQGVDEADVMKNDSRYIYLIKEEGKAISIVDTKDTLKEISTIQGDEEICFNEMLLDGDQLIVIGDTYKALNVDNAINQKQTKDVIDKKRTFATISIYNISNRMQPKLDRKIEVEGQSNEVRKIDNKLYVLTSSPTPYINQDSITDQELLSYYSDSKIKEGKHQSIAFENMYYEPWSYCNSKDIVTVIPLNDESIEVKAILGSQHQSYMNKESLYLMTSGHNRESYISKFAIKTGMPQYQATGSVKGEILNQFSLDEYEGNLRVATTDYSGNEMTSGICIFNKDMQQIGEITGLAAGERIYSARFEGEKGYLVTFKETDPLFVFDLSNPSAPKALGQLKIPGFSQYLHSIADGLVVGIGRATEEMIARDEDGTERVTDMRVAGIKLSLFDVTNPAQPTEINHIILGTEGSYSIALDHHNAVMVNKDKKMLAIPVNLIFEDQEDFSGAYVFQVENRELVGKAKLGRLTECRYTYYKSYNDESRICYIGDKIYYVYDGAVNMYSMGTFKRLKTIYLAK